MGDFKQLAQHTHTEVKQRLENVDGWWTNLEFQVNDMSSKARVTIRATIRATSPDGSWGEAHCDIEYGWTVLGKYTDFGVTVWRVYSPSFQGKASQTYRLGNKGALNIEAIVNRIVKAINESRSIGQINVQASRFNDSMIAEINKAVEKYELPAECSRGQWSYNGCTIYKISGETGQWRFRVYTPTTNIGLPSGGFASFELPIPSLDWVDGAIEWVAKISEGESNIEDL